MSNEKVTDGLHLHMDFENISSTIIPDVSGNGYTSVIRNYDAGGVSLQKDVIYGREEMTIILPGGVNGGYIELPQGVLNNREGLTISLWCKLISCQDYHTLLSFGQESQLYIKVIGKYGSDEIYGIPCVTNSGRSQEREAATKIPLQLGRWYQLCVTLENTLPAKLSYYIDGQLASYCEQKNVSSITLSKEGSCLIGRGIYGTDQINAAFADVRLYDRSLSQKEIENLFYISDEDRMKADKEYLDQIIPQFVTEHVDLPLKGRYESIFAYASSQEEIFSSIGNVIRPGSGKDDALVNLQVTISYRKEKMVSDYSIRVGALPSKTQLLSQDADTLDIMDKNHVYRDLQLPSRGKLGSSICWVSSNPQIIDSKGRLQRAQLNGERKKIELIAVLSYENEKLTKPFIVTVLPVYERKISISVPVLRIKTEPGTNPVLPDKVWIGYQDGTKRYELVKWSSVLPLYLEHRGFYTVTGYIKSNSGVEVKADILVKNYYSKKYRKVLRTAPGIVRLTEDTVFTQNNKRDLAYLKLLDADRMLYAFRTTFGVDTKSATPLGGWDEPQGLLRGHSTGHFLSALAIAYGSTKDKELKDKIDYLVDSLRSLQILSKGNPGEFVTKCSKEDAAQSKWSKNPSEWGEGYLSAYSPDQFALLEQYTTYPTIWAPYYTLHKILAGLLDCYEYANSNTALSIASGIADWVYARLSCCSTHQLDRMWSMYIAGEYGGMNDSLSKLYLITKNPFYLEAAFFFDNHKVFRGLAYNVDTITTLHANQHIPQIIGALEEYEACGKINYYKAAYYFWHLITKHYAYSIGGVGRGENFKEADILAGNIETNRNCETCAAYNMLKLTSSLYCYEPEQGVYMDYYEKTLFNQIAASQNPIVSEYMHHGVTYMLPIGPGQYKEYGSDYNEFTCCHGTGMENHVKYQDNIYYMDLSSEILYINLYIPSEIEWKEKGIILTQSGGFPSEKMKITVKGNTGFTCRLRIPNWCRTGFCLTLNGERIQVEPESDYISITRKWSDQDILELELPYELTLDFTPDDLDLPVASVKYGPLVMVAQSDSQDFITLVLSPNITDDFTVTWEKYMPVLNYDNLKFIPMYAAHHMKYHTYFKIVNA